MSIYFLMLIMAVIIIAIPGAIIAGMFRRGKTGICATCGFQGQAKLHTRGSILIEIVLWLAFIVPGVIYSLWRLSTRQEVCPSCANPSMIPLDSPRGKLLQKELLTKTA